MGWNRHFVKCTNRATCNNSGHQMQRGLRKMSSGACDDKASEKEGTLEIREGSFLTVPLGRSRPREEWVPGSHNMEVAEVGPGPGCPGPEAEPLSPACKVSVERDAAMDGVRPCKVTHTPT